MDLRLRAQTLRGFVYTLKKDREFSRSFLCVSEHCLPPLGRLRAVQEVPPEGAERALSVTADAVPAPPEGDP